MIHQLGEEMLWYLEYHGEWHRFRGWMIVSTVPERDGKEQKFSTPVMWAVVWL
jgi:hypothetical protein